VSWAIYSSKNSVEFGGKLVLRLIREIHTHYTSNLQKESFNCSSAEIFYSVSSQGPTKRVNLGKLIENPACDSTDHLLFVSSLVDDALCSGIKTRSAALILQAIHGIIR
jgi:hypothetical protein